MKSVIVLSLAISFVFAKSCYWVDKTQLCYTRYYNSSGLKEYNKNLRYYIRDNKVYSFSNIIKVRLKFNGALFILLDDFNLEFEDVGFNKVYSFKLKDYDELFSILSNLNNQSYVKDAKPIVKRVYRKGEHLNKKTIIKTGTIKGSSSSKVQGSVASKWKK